MVIARRPNLFLVGFPKAGTTTLAAMLAKHSNIYAPHADELHFFEVKYKNLPFAGPGDMKAAPIKTQAEYLDLFDQRSEEYLLDYTPAYIEHPEVASDIKAFNPDANILIALRDPVERCFSNYSHLVREGRETLSFEDAIEAEEARVQANWGMFWRYRGNSFYYERTKAYLDNFGRSNVKFVLASELRESPASVSREIQIWLGLPWEEISITEQHNRSGRPSWKLKLLRTAGLGRIAKKLARRVVSDDAVRRIKERNISKIELSEQTRHELREYFRDDVLKLEALIHEDLSAWYE